MRRFLEWERGLREHARAVDEERNQDKHQTKIEKEARKEQRAEVRAEKRRRKEQQQYGNLNAVLSEAEREKILSAKIKQAVALGFRVENKGSTWASLVNPAGDPIGTGGTVAAFATLGLSLMAHKGRRGRENDKTLYIEVHPNGVVESSGNSFLLAGTDYAHVPRIEEE